MRKIEQIPQLLVEEQKPWQEYLFEVFLIAVGTLILTGIIYAFHLYPAIPNISIVYLLLILVLAGMRGRFAALVAAVVAFLSFDFFLVPPLYTLTISRWEEWLALFVFLATALIASQLTANMRNSIEQARLRERELRILYETGRVLNATENLEEQLDSIALALVRVFSPWGVRSCALLLPDPDGVLAIRADAPIRIEPFNLLPAELEAAKTVMAQGAMLEMNENGTGASKSMGAIEKPASFDGTIVPTADSPQELLRLIPLKAGSQVLGVLALRIEHGLSWFASREGAQDVQVRPGAQEAFFMTFLDQTILIIERASLRAQALPGGA